MNEKSGTLNGPVSRMQFLQGDFTGRCMVVRPPWAVEESRFIELCSGCGECVNHCPTAILSKGRGGLPVVDFHAGQCEFCAQCVSYCRTGALQSSQSQTDQPWQIKAHFSDQCLAFQSVVCRTCAEQCESQAIVFRLSPGRIPWPELVLSHCNGCGACYAPCPTNAISIRAPEA